MTRVLAANGASGPMVLGKGRVGAYYLLIGKNAPDLHQHALRHKASADFISGPIAF